MNQLVLMRHGEAAWVSPDAARPLTEAGRAASRVVIQQRAGELVRVDRLLVSPYVRAQETAMLVREQFPLLDMLTVDWLTPDIDPTWVVERLATDYASGGSVMLVAHNPLLTRLLNLLTGAASGRYHMGTSALAMLGIEFLAAGGAELEWLELGR